MAFPPEMTLAAALATEGLFKQPNMSNLIRALNVDQGTNQKQDQLEKSALLKLLLQGAR